MIQSRAFKSFRRRVTRWMPRRAPDLEFVPEGWSRAIHDPRIKGWDVPAVAAAQAERLDAWRSVAEGVRPLGSSTDLGSTTHDLVRHNTLVSFAYVAALAARPQGELAVLDWGGGLGQYGWLARGVLPGVRIVYHCQDVPHQCALGRRLQPEVEFIETGSPRPRPSYDLVLASGALQYVEDWGAALKELARASHRYLFVTRLPVVLDAPSYVVLQRAYVHGYNTEFLGWRLNREEFLQTARRLGLTLVREFLIGEQEWASKAPRPAEARGYLFGSGRDA